MALSIGVKIGSKLTIGKSNMRILDVVDGTTISLEVDGQRFIVSENERTEILPEVFVSSGLERTNVVGVKSGRLAFEAPRHIIIRRVPPS